jgi:type VI secretion system secreted protein VgrG
MASFTQDKRPLRVTTGLGKDALLLERFSGEEGVSTPFHFVLDMLSENPAIAPADMLRKTISVDIEIPGGETRVVHGFVKRFSQLGRRGGLAAYRAEMVPWLWFLSLTNDCRIFQNLSVSDIVSKVFKDLGYSNFTFKLMGPGPKRIYCVQYRESALAFVSRLLEEEGIFYFFEHTSSKHTLVLTDHPSQVPACPDVSKVRMTATQSWQMAEEPLVTGLEVEHSAVTEKIELKDYDFEKPSAGLTAAVAGQQKDEVYDYPGGYVVKGDGDRYARLRLEQKEAERELAHGESNVPAFTCGHKFDLTEHPTRALNQSYHLLRVRHSASISNYTTGTGEYEYSNSFDAIPSGVPYRPPLVTPRALVLGSQTAVVVGPGGEEIYADKYSRVKVQFHWDRQGKKDQNSSCWVRVSSAWAGKNWGMIQIPRMGQEVIVDFLEGNPDQPIITGRVYNADQMPPYALPANMTQSGTLTRSSKGGSAANANEIRFEDKKGSEQLFIHAEKNEDHEVENDRTDFVGHDETGTIGHDQQLEVKHDRTRKVGHDESVSVVGNQAVNAGADRSVSVGKNQNHSISGNDSTSVSGNRNTSVSGKDALTIGGDLTSSVGGKESHDVSADRTTSIGKNDSLQIGQGRTVDVAKDDALNVGKKLAIVAADEIVLKTGDATLTMKKDGTITLKGKDVTINASGKMSVKASGDVVMKGSKVTQN